MSKKPFEIIYDHKRTITKSSEINYFLYNDITKLVKGHVLNAFVRINPRESTHEMHIVDKLVDRSFTIEGLPAGSDEKCGKEGLEDMNMIGCRGKIKLRPN